MSFLRRLSVLFSVTMLLFLGIIIILFVIDPMQTVRPSIFNILHAISMDRNLQVIFIGIGAAILILNFVFYNLFSVNIHRDKIIAFDNPSGRVSFSLVALEDLTRRTLIKMNEVFDAKPNIIATKKGLQIKIRLTLNSEVNVPEFTSRIQELIKHKIEDVVGLDEPLDIAVYVNRINFDIKNKNVKDKKAESVPPTIPFHGYRA